MNAQLEEEKSKYKEKLPIRVLFVCTGNTCRSPMAAAVLNALGGGRFTAVSAGLAVAGGRDMSENAKQALKNAGIEPAAHISRPVAERDMQENDIVVGVSASHFMVLLQSYPVYAAKLEAMDDIGDPYGGDLAVYEACLAKITAWVRERFAL